MSLELIEGMSSRRRRPNWTEQECLLLTQLIQDKKAVIRGKCSTGVSTQAKRQAWEEITQAVNTAFPQIQRTVSDCNKKWENLLAKSREEIKRQKRQAGTDGLSHEQFSPVTQLVISVMNLSDVLRQVKKDSSVSEIVETHLNSCDEDRSDYTVDERVSSKNSGTECGLPTSVQSSTSPAKQNQTFICVSKAMPVQFSTGHVAGFSAAAEQPAAPCSTPPSALQGTTLQERIHLEMSVLRRQEAVLKLQEEYYTLKIKMMRKQMQETLSED